MGAQLTDLELLTYLPRWVALPTGDEWRKTNTALATRRCGAILFLDLAGFTQLAERLATRGTRGAEDLAKILNRSFGAIIQVIEAHGGDIIAFAGDGILSFWDQTLCEHPLQSSVCCGVALQDLVAARGHGDAPSVQMRVAIELGDVFLCRVGGVDNRWHHMVVGDAIRTVGAAYRRANIGQVLLCPAAAVAAVGFCEGETVAERFFSVAKAEPLPTPSLPPLMPQLPTSPIMSLLPRGILERVRFDRGRWLAEFRNMSIVQIQIHGVRFEDCLLRILQTGVEAIQSVALRFEAITYQALMDDKGVCVVVVFGLPTLAHEDDALRAVEAARAIHAKLTAEGISTSMGIATGRVFCGECGAHTRREYSIHGQAMNLSSRLMEAAGGGILCDLSTFEATDRHTSFSAPLTLDLKGWADTVCAYRPLSPLPRSRKAVSRQLIGRAPECAALQRSLDEMRGGSGRAVLVRGEAGIGKTQLLDHFAGMARAKGCRVVRGATTAIDRSTLYFAWRPIVSELLGAPPSASSSEIQAILAAALRTQPQLRAWAPLLDDILGSGLPQTALADLITGAARAASIEELVIHFLARSAAEAPLVLIIDDLHWLDGASAGLLQAVAHRLPQILVVASTRPIRAATLSSDEGFGGLSFDELDLGPLGADEVSQLISHLLGTAEVSEPLANLIHTRSGGSPFFSEELALGLRDSAGIAIREGRWQLSDDRGIGGHRPLPSSISSAIISRIDALSLLGQSILKVASIIGGELTNAIIRNIYPDSISLDHCREILDSLVGCGLLYDKRKDDEQIYIFRHSLIEDVTYELLSFEQRRSLHHKAALIIEDLNKGRLDRVCTQLARHWEAAEQFTRALEYLERAAKQALRNYSNRDALRYARKAMHLTEQVGVVSTKEGSAVWEIIRGDAYHELRDFENASLHFGRAMVALGRNVPMRPRESVPSLLANVVWQLAMRLRRGPGKRFDFDRQARLQQAAHIYERLSEEYFFANESIRLLNGTLASLNLAERSGSLPEIVSGFNALGLGLGLSGMVRTARFFCSRALQLAGSAGGPPEMARAYLIAGVLESGLGNWKCVDEYGASARRLFGELGDRFRLQNTHCMLVFCNLLRGRLQDAQTGLDGLDALIAADPDVSVQVKTWVLCARTIEEYMRADVRPAMLDRLRSAAELKQVRADELLCHGVLATALVRRDDLQAAEQVARRGAAILAKCSSVWAAFGAFGAAGVVETLILLWEREARSLGKVEEHRSAALAACSRFVRLARISPVCRPDALLLRGRVAVLLGNPARATHLWQQAIVAAERLDMQHVAAAAWQLLGSAPSATASRRKLRRVHGHRISESLDMTVDAEQTRLTPQHSAGDDRHG